MKHSFPSHDDLHRNGTDDTGSAVEPSFRRLSPDARRARLAMARDIPASYLETYIPGRGLPVDLAALMIENVVGVLSLPVGIGLNVLVNGRDYLVPMVVEEPSVVAAVSAMAKRARAAGGVLAEADSPEMIGQIQILDCSDPDRAVAALLDAKEELLAQAQEQVPRLAARGGGVRDMEVRHVVFDEDGVVEPMIVVHFVVDTRDAMGANIVNTLVEQMAPRVVAVSGGRVGLRILSNLADRRRARARVVFPPEALAGKGRSGVEVIDGIVQADRFAVADPYRAATHNKGIMNGIDAVALATGNDWRALEAGAHAYAARDGRYRPLARWRKLEDGRLEGRLELPLAVGTVGGAIQVHPTVRTNLHVLGVETAGELAEVMAAVGLLQNLAALRALATEGIQRGHMAMHARSVALSAGVPRAWVSDVVARMVEAGTIHADGARSAYRAVRKEESQETVPGEVVGRGRASGKVILLGEHAVVHGCPALASSLDRGVEVVCRRREGAAWVEAPALPLSGYLFTRTQDPVRVALRKVLACLGTSGEGLSITLQGDLPPGKGLGSSAALAVAALRAVSEALGQSLDEATLLTYAGEVERVFHGNPSGIDHTVSVKGGMIRYQRGAPPVLETVRCARSWPIVLLDSGEVGPTSVLVGRVLSLLQAEPRRVEGIFDEIRGLVETGTRALETGDADTLGRVMSRNHELLKSLNVSTSRLDALVDLAMEEGAAGAKLTGAGGGGMVVALCPEGTRNLLAAAEDRGIPALAATIPAGTKS